MLNKFLKEADFTGIKFHMYSGETLKKKTVFGGIVTILIGIFIISIILVYSKKFIMRKNPSVTISIENNLKYEFFDLKKEKIFFAFRIEDYDGRYINETNILYFKIYYYTSKNENGIYRKKISDEYLSYHICNESDFQNTNLSNALGTLYCPEFGGKQFGGYWDSPDLYYFEIQVYFCENGSQFSINNTKCTSLTQLRDFLNQDNPKFFAFYYPSIEFNPLSYYEPLNIRYKNHYYCLSYRLQRNDDIFLKKTIMNDNKGWIFDTSQNFSVWGIDSFQSTYSYFSDEDLTNEGSSTKIYEINIYSTIEKNYYTRYYMKVQNVVAIVGSLLNLVRYFCSNISHFIGLNIQKLEIIQNSFNFEEKNKKKILFQKNQNLSNQIVTNNSKVKNDSPVIIPKNSNKLVNGNIIIQNSLFESSNLDGENSVHLKKEKKSNVTSSNALLNKLPISLTQNTAINNFINTNTNQTLSNNLIVNNKDKAINEQSGYQFLTNKSNCSQKSSVNIYKEDINIIFVIINNIKLKFSCCYKKNTNSKNNTLSLLNWYYIYLIQSERYLEIVKEFDFIKKLILNNQQNRSLLFLKKININDENEKENLINIKDNNFENSVISYFNDLLKRANSNISRTDWFIMENLSDNLKKNIIY